MTPDESWNTHPERACTLNIEGILDWGEGIVTQVYMYGNTVYEAMLGGG